MFEVVDSKSQNAIIKVIGVGGCGGNAIDHMIDKNLTGVEFRDQAQSAGWVYLNGNEHYTWSNLLGVG